MRPWEEEKERPVKFVGILPTEFIDKFIRRRFKLPKKGNSILQLAFRKGNLYIASNMNLTEANKEWDELEERIQRGL